jgi:TatD DNase family protein
VFARARAVGVTCFLNPAYDLASSRRALALAQARPDVVAAVGFHPNDAGSYDAGAAAGLRDLVVASAGRVVAIGEIGLDYHWNTFEPAVQQAAFIAQLGLARELNLPVIIHSRDAYDDTLDILEAEWAGRPLVLHSFGGAINHLERALACGFHIGISGPVTYPNAAVTREVVRNTPLDRLLIETDAPYLAPQRYRGRRNEPSYVRLVAEKIADIREIMVADVAAATMANGRHLFGVV